MRFIILYRNDKQIRELIEEWVIGASEKGFNFWSKPIQTPFFQIRPRWPTNEELFSLPMWMQCEEVIIKNKKLVTIRAQVIDVECLAEEIPEYQLTYDV